MYSFREISESGVHKYSFPAIFPQVQKGGCPTMLMMLVLVLLQTLLKMLLLLLIWVRNVSRFSFVARFGLLHGLFACCMILDLAADAEKANAPLNVVPSPAIDLFSPSPPPRRCESPLMSAQAPRTTLSFGEKFFPVLLNRTNSLSWRT